ncbi:hypothetical protein WYH_01994 [Croceibacterium atlanticum]|uniref:Uncharacterized protein n=1 Tax=Croceibacterium atlanticum TaxID=1267766 RepID=A0A0F7KV22_9SPHN|nr:hypothetical protein WYH_01991 [Croceibacterium atlanticum]AKH43029.1 hypothetical protein WYH_01994 [Croceibacterium atlanticum]
MEYFAGLDVSIEETASPLPLRWIATAEVARCPSGRGATNSGRANFCL